MPWVRIDEEFPDHPKVVTAGPLAGWLHVCALAYCNRMMTDGFVPMSQVRRLVDFDGIVVITEASEGDVRDAPDVDPRTLAETLVSVGMWERRQGGYAIHDYLNYQPSRAEVEAQKKVKSDAGKAGGQRSGESRRSKSEAQPEAESKQNPKQTGSRPPSKTEADNQPKVEAGGQAKTKPDPDPVVVLRSSSSNLGVGAMSAEEEEFDLRAKEAAMIVARRRLKSREGPQVNNPTAWLRRAADDVYAEHGAELRAAACEGLSREAMADRIMPRAGSPWPEWSPPAHPDEPPASVEGLATVRSALGGGA